MTCREKLKLEHPDVFENAISEQCPSIYGYLPDPPNCISGNIGCDNCWDREIPETNPSLVDEDDKELSAGNNEEAVTNAPHILDSGARRKFESGAVRDIQEGKGRCDLLPLDVVAEYVNLTMGQFMETSPDLPISRIAGFQNTGDVTYLYRAIECFDGCCGWHNHYTMLLEVSKHFEEGCKKYGENNWRRGIPVHCYIDSAVRHYLKFLRGDKDEPHDRAVCWNLMCAIWTCKHKPELNDYRKENASCDS